MTQATEEALPIGILQLRKSSGRDPHGQQLRAARPAGMAKVEEQVPKRGTLAPREEGPEVVRAPSAALAVVVLIARQASVDKPVAVRALAEAVDLAAAPEGDSAAVAAPVVAEVEEVPAAAEAGDAGSLTRALHVVVS